MIRVDNNRRNPQLFFQDPLYVHLSQRYGNTGFIPMQDSPVNGILSAGLEQHFFAFVYGNAGNHWIGHKTLQRQSLKGMPGVES